MSEIVAVKVSKTLKERMRRLKGKVDWPSEIREFLEGRARNAEAEGNLHEVVQLLRRTGRVRKGFSAASVREDRDSR